MKKTTIAAADFQKKAYAQPQMKVVEVYEECMICQSADGASTQSLDEEDFEWDS